MSIATEIERLQGAKAALRASLEGKGVSVPEVETLDAYGGYVEQIESGGYERPADWLALPELEASDNMFVGLLAVYDQGPEYVALSARGNYIVDWGDGTTDMYTSDETAQHAYDYHSPSLVGTECSRGYRQVIVRVWAQAGQAFTGINLQQRPSIYSSGYSAAGWLDIAVAGPSLTYMGIGGTVYRLAMLEQAKIHSHALGALDYLFRDCFKLQSVPVLYLSSATSMNGLFYNCHSIAELPPLDAAPVTAMIGMFSNCYSLLEGPAMNTSAVTSFGNVFSSCYSLRRIPLYDTSAVTNMSYAFLSCQNLEELPPLDLSSVTSFIQPFDQCLALRTLPPLATPTTNIYRTFYRCESLRAIEMLDASQITAANSPFNGCYSLRRMLLHGMRESFSTNNSDLSADALNELYESLGSTSGETVNVAYNVGAPDSDSSIATSKGWTVVW